MFRDKSKNDETFTLAEARIAIDGDARRRRRRHRGGGSGETRDELVEPAHRSAGGRLGCGHFATPSFSISLSLTLLRLRWLRRPRRADTVRDKGPARRDPWCSATRWHSFSKSTLKSKSPENDCDEVEEHHRLMPGC